MNQIHRLVNFIPHSSPSPLPRLTGRMNVSHGDDKNLRAVRGREKGLLSPAQRGAILLLRLSGELFAWRRFKNHSEMMRDDLRLSAGKYHIATFYSCLWYDDSRNLGPYLMSFCFPGYIKRACFGWVFQHINAQLRGSALIGCYNSSIKYTHTCDRITVNINALIENQFELV